MQSQHPSLLAASVLRYQINVHGQFSGSALCHLSEQHWEVLIMVYTLSSSTWIRFFLLSIIDGDLLKSALIPLCVLPLQQLDQEQRSKCARCEDTSDSATSQCGASSMTIPRFIFGIIF